MSRGIQDRGTEVIVVGGGLIGLCCAAALAAREVEVTLVGEARAGEASPAAGGMLAPSLEAGEGAAHRFAVAARDRYPAFLDAVEAATGVRVPALRNGILELALTEERAGALRTAASGEAAWLDAAELRAAEPALAPAMGALLHRRDGAIDNVALLDAMHRLVSAHRRIRCVTRAAAALELDARGAVVRLSDGGRVEAPRVVLASGAWVAQLAGLPRPLPVEPVRGQMVALRGAPIGHVTYGPSGYAIPRGGVTVVGSTMEHVGFAPAVTAEGVAAIAAAAAEIAPALASLPVESRWSGLRPVTPDLLPILGPDPDVPGLLYACGHSRNGILLGPLTGECIAELATGRRPEFDLAPFAVERFRNVA